MERMEIESRWQNEIPSAPRIACSMRVRATAQRVGRLAEFEIDPWVGESGVAAAKGNMTFVAGETEQEPGRCSGLVPRRSIKEEVSRDSADMAQMLRRRASYAVHEHGVLTSCFVGCVARWVRDGFDPVTSRTPPVGAVRAVAWRPVRRFRSPERDSKIRFIENALGAYSMRAYLPCARHGLARYELPAASGLSPNRRA
jgi:hypothetical protein